MWVPAGLLGPGRAWGWGALQGEHEKHSVFGSWWVEREGRSFAFVLAKRTDHLLPIEIRQENAFSTQAGALAVRWGGRKGLLDSDGRNSS